ncbi:DUF927 domain-containing protein [Pistricoccus aurantiacus]|uniref:DUF927 domain-containing protein n=1 Tax=Pistricoccus aurantiacus TaxID=1883414 RepID=UPI00362BE13E
MKFQLRDSGLYCYSSGEWQRVGGWIEVVARTRLSNKKHGHGALLQWKNMDNLLLREVVYARNLNGDNARQIRELLVDTGYLLEPGNISWTRLQRYLLEEMAKAPPATIVDRTGWHNTVFATSSWTAGQAGEQHHFVGQLSTSPILQEKGSLQDWQAHIGRLCVGNPLAVFSVGVALAAPMLQPADLENGVFHLAGLSGYGKATLLQVATSVCGAPTFMRSWISTSNGLTAVSAEHNDMLLALDEIGLAKPEDIDTATYYIMNSASKLRAKITGDLAPQTHCRTLALSSGEIWFSEIFQQVGKQAKAGQQNHLVEIPVFGRFGAFDDLHGLPSSQELVDILKRHTRRYYGTLFREWVEHLTDDIDELPAYIQRETRKLLDLWVTPHMAPQVIRVLKRFALVAVALCLACKNYLVPWTEASSVQAVEKVIGAWLQNRGHIFDSEEYRLLIRLRDAVVRWNHRFSKFERGDYGRMIGLRRDVDGERQWLIPKNTFLEELGLPSRYMRDIEPLFQRGFLDANEKSRGTIKIKLRDRSERFFALWPDRIKAYWESLPDGDGLSQFPTYPSIDSEVAENE